MDGDLEGGSTPFEGAADAPAEPSPEAGSADGGGLFAAAENDASFGEAGELPGAVSDAAVPDGSQPLISAEESDAIIAAMRAGSLRPEPVAPPPSSRPADPATGLSAHTMQIGAPDGPLRKSVEAADRAAVDLASIVLDKLLELASVIAGATLIPAEVTTVEAAAAPYISTAAAWDVVCGDETGLRATIVVGGQLAETLLARRFGAADAVARPTGAGRGLSNLGRRVLTPFAQACVDCVASALMADASRLRLVAAGSTPTKVAPFAPCLTVGVRARVGDLEDDVLCLLYSEGLTHAARPSAGGDRDRWTKILGDVDVELVARLGAASTSVRELLALGVGSVVRLDGAPERPVGVWVDGAAVLEGMPQVHEGNLAIEVVR